MHRQHNHYNTLRLRATILWRFMLMAAVVSSRPTGSLVDFLKKLLDSFTTIRPSANDGAQQDAWASQSASDQYPYGEDEYGYAPSPPPLPDGQGWGGDGDDGQRDSVTTDTGKRRNRKRGHSGVGRTGINGEGFDEVWMLMRVREGAGGTGTRGTGEDRGSHHFFHHLYCVPVI